MAVDHPVTLRVGRLKLVLSPAIGGAISAFQWIDGDEARPILRQSPSPLERVLDASSFPLVPYVNRIRGGEFAFEDQTVRLAPNMAGDSTPLHGQGWLGSWTVEGSGGREADLHFRHDRGEWPWDYEARQSFQLDERGFSTTISCRNLGPGAMPCGLGLHPYFPCGSETRIDTKVSVAWTIDEKVLPVEKVQAKGRYDLQDRLVCGQGLDNGFGGWGGKARISDPHWPYEVTVASGDANFFQLYSPESGGIFVAEPVSHANAALNAPRSEWQELGIRILEEREAMELTMRIDVIPR